MRLNQYNILMSVRLYNHRKQRGGGGGTVLQNE